MLPEKREAMKHVSGSLALALFLTAFGGLPAQAHSLWLESGESCHEAGKKLTINVGFNEEFELAEIPEGSVAYISVPILEGREGSLPLSQEKHPGYAWKTAPAGQPGSYVAFCEYRPFIMKYGREGQKNRYFLTAKHVMNVGGRQDSEFVSRALGKSRLEIVPLDDPAGLKVGETLPIQVLFDGKPIERAEITGSFRGFYPPGKWGTAKAFYCRTDKEGRVDFIPARSGLWVVRVRHAVPDDRQDEAKESVHISTLTFHVQQ